mmetsp:Transcript_120986/g.347613  ORF Transcript_120986/g.347613 Transcript_120986/m.347613 type:complete len:204 (+) Transcript_120986:977-1588(+)
MLVIPIGVQELGVHLQNILQREGLDVDQPARLDFPVLRSDDVRIGVDGPDRLLHLLQGVFADEVALVQQHAVGEGDLLHALVLHALWLLLVQVIQNVLGIHHGDDAVQAVEGADLVVDEEGLRHWRRVRQAGRLDDHTVEAGDLLLHALQGDRQVATHRATDASVHHLDNLLVGGLLDDLFVDAHLTELVLDNGEAHAMAGRG